MSDVITDPDASSVRVSSSASRVRETLRLYHALSKPRVIGMVVVVTAMGFLLAGGDVVRQFWIFISTVIGTVMTGAGSSSLNQYLEVESDALMNRTRNRPLPSGRLSREAALYYGVFMVLVGVGILVFNVNLLTGFLALLTSFLYVLVYTPLKKVTWLNTLVGAIPGALPPVGGWVAVTGNIDIGACLLFSILFIWQLPHFFAIAWMYREDYARGKYQMLPVIDPTGERTFRQIVWFSHLLIAVSILPVWYGLVGIPYLIGAIFFGVYFLVAGLELAKSGEYLKAKKVLKVSLIYLPALLISVLIDMLTVV